MPCLEANPASRSKIPAVQNPREGLSKEGREAINEHNVESETRLPMIQ